MRSFKALLLSTAVTAASATFAACASSPAQRAASSGDRAALSTAVAEREKRGDLSNGEAASLAHAVASRDLRAARAASVSEALARVEDARPCARELHAPLEDVMDTHDEAGAAAALALLDAGELSQSDARPFATDPAAPWRAVGARSLVRSEDRNLRLKALLDPDPRVRRQAVRAAREDQDPNDLGPLSEAARVDPEPIVRTEAVRAMVELQPLPAGELADVLRDLWPKADEGLREDIAIAWASPRVWDEGGSEALLTLVASGHGPGVIEGAAAILRHGTMGGEVVAEAIAQMERAIEQGSRERRQQAIAGAPLERPELLAAVKKASEDGDSARAGRGLRPSGRGEATRRPRGPRVAGRPGLARRAARALRAGVAGRPPRTGVGRRGFCGPRTRTTASAPRPRCRPWASPRAPRPCSRTKARPCG